MHSRWYIGLNSGIVGSCGLLGCVVCRGYCFVRSLQCDVVWRLRYRTYLATYDPCLNVGIDSTQRT